MELLTLAATIAGIIAAIIGLIVVVKKISAFYRARFQFSIWSGVLLFLIALALLIISETSEIAQSTVYIMLAAAAAIAIITIYNDIRLAGLWWGVLALFLQILFSLCFVIFIFCALVGLAMKKLFNIRNSLITSVFDGLGLKGEMALLLYFLHP